MTKSPADQEDAVSAPPERRSEWTAALIPTRLTQLVRELLAQDGHGGADALEDGRREGGADGQAVDEVVQAVAQRDHPGQRADVRVRRPLQPVAAAVAAGAPPGVWTLRVLREASDS